MPESTMAAPLQPRSQNRVSRPPPSRPAGKAAAHAASKPTSSAALTTAAAAAAVPATSSGSNGPIDDRYAPKPPATVFDPSGRSYAVGARIGKGGFAICYEAKVSEIALESSSTSMIALKVVKTNMPRRVAEKFRSELQIHSKMRHAHIVEYHRAFTLGGSTYLALGLCTNGSLKDMCTARKALTLPEIRRFGIQICSAMHYMHTRSVVHRDLKMGNIFLDGDMNVKIGDFGLAAVLMTDKQRGELIRRVTLCGTPNYIAPEVLDKERGQDSFVDIWSFGVLLYTLLVGTTPFSRPGDKDHKIVFERVRTNDWMWPGDCTKTVPREARDLVHELLQEDSSRRPCADAIVERPFFQMPGGIPATMDSTCMTHIPTWIDNRRVPKEMKTGSRRMTHREMLVAANFQSASADVVDQLYAEEQNGRAPIVPLRSVYERAASTGNATDARRAAPKRAEPAAATVRPTSSAADARPFLKPFSTSSIPETMLDLPDLSARLSRATKGPQPADWASASRPPCLVAYWRDFTDRIGVLFSLQDGTLGLLPTASRFSGLVVLTTGQFEHDTLRPSSRNNTQFWRGAESSALQRHIFYERSTPSRLARLELSPDKLNAGDIHSADGSNSSSMLALRQLRQTSEKLMPNITATRAHMPLTVARDHGSGHAPASSPSSLPVITMWSIYGNVAVWIWSDGGLQFDFADGITVLLSADTRWVEVVYPQQLVDQAESPRNSGEHGSDERSSGQTADVPAQILSMPLSVILSATENCNRPMWAAATALELHDKVTWIRCLVKVWRLHGGVGTMGREKLRYGEGMLGGSSKMRWMTVAV